MFLTNTRPRRHQEERQGTTFKPKAAAVHSSLLQDGIINRFIKNGMNAERTHTLSADQTHNCILPPASPLQPVFRPGYQRMQRGSISQSLPFPIWLQDTAPGLLLGHTAPTAIPSLQPLPDVLHTSCFCQALCRAASLPSCQSAPSPIPHTLPALGGL